LQRRGFIEGIEQATEQKWFENQWKEFHCKIPAGQSRVDPPHSGTNVRMIASRTRSTNPSS
jgi:hypothetical protein